MQEILYFGLSYIIESLPTTYILTMNNRHLSQGKQFLAIFIGVMIGKLTGLFLKRWIPSCLFCNPTNNKSFKLLDKNSKLESEDQSVKVERKDKRITITTKEHPILVLVQEIGPGIVLQEIDVSEAIDAGKVRLCGKRIEYYELPPTGIESAITIYQEIMPGSAEGTTDWVLRFRVPVPLQ